ncbi:MAG: hypothetical protein V4579_12045 [Pseudomonadota bacterium]
MSGINWSLGVMPDIAGNALKAFDEGRKHRAWDEYAKDPNNLQGINALLAVDPENGFRALQHQRLLSKDKSEAEATTAAGDYILASRGFSTSQPSGSQAAAASQPFGGYNALAPRATAPTSPFPVSGQTPGIGDGIPGNQPMGGPAVSNAPEQGGAAPAQDGSAPKVDWTVLGKPRSAADAAFLRAVRANPKGALQIDSDLRDNMVKRLKAEHDFSTSRSRDLPAPRMRPVISRCSARPTNVRWQPGWVAFAEPYRPTFPGRRALSSCACAF